MRLNLWPLRSLRRRALLCPYMHLVPLFPCEPEVAPTTPIYECVGGRGNWCSSWTRRDNRVASCSFLPTLGSRVVPQVRLLNIDDRATVVILYLQMEEQKYAGGSVGEWEVQVVEVFEKDFVGVADVIPPAGAFTGQYVVISLWQSFGDCLQNMRIWRD